MMKKILFIIIVSFLLITMSSSGCIDNTKANSTWGEKKISLDAIKISNTTVGNRSENNVSYYVSGYLINQNSIEALDPKITITTYYANGTVFAVNETPYLDPKNLPANGKSYFYARFEDPDRKIANFEVNVLSAKGELV